MAYGAEDTEDEVFGGMTEPERVEPLEEIRLMPTVPLVVGGAEVVETFIRCEIDGVIGGGRTILDNPSLNGMIVSFRPFSGSYLMIEGSVKRFGSTSDRRWKACCR